jgi:Holliday junction resolvase
VTHYRQGATFERKIMVLLADHGYVVFRSAGSHGVADVIAFKPGEVLFVQCKTSGTISIREWNLLYAAANGIGAVPLMALRPGRGRVEFRRLMGVRSPRVQNFEAWHPDVIEAVTQG